MAYNNNSKNAMLDELGSIAVYMSLHSGDPSTTGANEITGGSPAYARQACTFAAASGGSMALNGTEQFDVPATTVAYIGLWSASSGGTFYGYADVTDEVFASQGIYTVTGLTLDLNS